MPDYDVKDTRLEAKRYRFTNQFGMNYKRFIHKLKFYDYTKSSKMEFFVFKKKTRELLRGSFLLWRRSLNRRLRIR